MGAPSRRGRRRLILRLVLVLASALAPLLLLEGGLRLLALLHTRRAPLEQGPKILPDGRRVVRLLCLGDSNTYGLFEEAEDSYPFQLEKELAKSTPRTHLVQVIL